MLVIAISGAMASGKDTVAGIIEESLRDRYDVERFALANPLKDFAAKLFPNQDKFKLRSLYQALGDVVRGFDVYAFARYTAQEIREKNPDIAIISDLRFLAEYEYLRNEFRGGFFHIRVIAPLLLRKERLERRGRMPSEVELNHQSETEYLLIPAQFVIENSSSYQKLRTRVENAIRTIFKEEIVR
ncbi:MAG: hypothetical protein KM296_00185 [Brockia lithotrophica]|nr:hypothetical protein [Brockia lithotrophica]